MLIRSWQLQIDLSTHSTTHTEYEAIAYVSVDLSPVLPYLNTVLASAIYVPQTPALSWRYQGHNIGFWPNRIAVGDLESREEAEEMVARLVALVNETWERRADIQPDTTTHQRLQPLELYRLLPRTNCGQCGEETCYQFALKLVAAQTTLERCAPLYQEAGRGTRRQRLEALLEAKWPAF